MTSPPPRAELPVLASLPLLIESAKFRLRPVALTDADELWPFVSDPDLPKHMSWRAHRDRGETAAFLQSQIDGLAAGRLVNWAIEIAGKAGGLITLAKIEWQLSTDWRVDRAEIGYWLGPPHRGQRITSEATRLVMKFGFEALGLHKITIGHVEGNAASRRIIEGLRFRPTGVLREDAWKGGAWQHHHRYELTAGEWADTAPTIRSGSW